MSVIQKKTGVPREFIAALSVLFAISGIGIIIDWVLASTAGLFLYDVGFVLIALSSVFFLAALLDRSQSKES